MPTVDEQLIITDGNVRKWGTQLVALMAPDAPVPDVWFDEVDRLPILPSGALQMGYVTTDGITREDALSSEGTNMLQSLETVRTDITGIEKTLTVAFGEDNSYVQALWEGVPFEDFPTAPDGPWAFDDAGVSSFPYYRLVILMQDGVGSEARFRVEVAYRVQVTTKNARTLNRTDAETYGVTFGLFRDTTLGKTASRLQNGPGYPLPEEPPVGG